MEIYMDYDKLFAALSPATLELIREQLSSYELDLNNGLIEPGEKRDQELAWIERTREAALRIANDKR